MLSTFEAALLERHLRRCASCRAFAASAETQAQLLRGAALEQLSRPVLIPTRGRPAVARRGSLLGVAGGIAAAAAAAIFVLGPGTSGNRTGTPTRSAVRGGSTMLAVFSAQPTASKSIDIPRLRVEPATAADGPVHGLYGVPV
jgi:predicted anti-sigma-YlaC factor YlaD